MKNCWTNSQIQKLIFPQWTKLERRRDFFFIAKKGYENSPPMFRTLSDKVYRITGLNFR